MTDANEGLERKTRAPKGHKGALWFRFYTGVVHNVKVNSITDSLFKFWVCCLCVAKDNDGVLPETRALAFALRKRESVVAKQLNELCDAELFDCIGGIYTPHDWEDWQYESDTSTERVKRYRQRKGLPDETFHGVQMKRCSNVTETPRARAQIQSRADTEAEADTETPIPPFRGPVFSPPAEPQNSSAPERKLRKRVAYTDDWKIWYSLYPRHEAPGAGFAAWQKLSLEEKREAYRGLQRWLPVLMARIHGNGLDKGCPHPATWLNQRRWEGEPPPPELLAREATTPSERKENRMMDLFAERMAAEQEKTHGPH